VRVLIAGCGYVGCALAERLLAAGHRVIALRRSDAGAPPGAEPLRADLADPASLAGVPHGLDAVCYLASADGRDDRAYARAYRDGVAALLTRLAEHPHRPRFLFASSTAVYGQRDGEWVDEDSATDPLDFRGRRLLEGEERVAASGLPATVVRFAGIYGPGRRRLLDRVARGEAPIDPEGPRYTNRIHRDDCAGLLAHLLEGVDGGRASAPSRLLAVDDDPADEETVLTWLATQLRAPDPPRRKSGDATVPRANRRCRNARLRATGYPLRYPTFRDGYAAMLRDSP